MRLRLVSAATALGRFDVRRLGVRALRPVRAPSALHALLACLACVAPGACLPDPSGDFDHYTEDTRPFAQQVGDGGGSFDGAPPTQAVEGIYYGACITQLAFQQTDDAFNFYVQTKFTPEGSGGKLQLILQPLATQNDKPPPTASKAGTVGEVKDSGVPAAPNVDAAGRYDLALGTVTIPGTANPITGRDAIIEDTRLVGNFAPAKFCARLNGRVTQPVTVTLDPAKNVCQFYAIKDGDPTPPLTFQDGFEPEDCP